VHFGSGSGSPSWVWTRHDALFVALPSARDARGFTASTGQSAHATFADPPARSDTVATQTTTRKAVALIVRIE